MKTGLYGMVREVDDKPYPEPIYKHKRVSEFPKAKPGEDERQYLFRLEKVYEDEIGIEERIDTIKKYIVDIRKQCEDQKLSFYDEEEHRYINSIYDYFYSYDAYFKRFLEYIIRFYDNMKMYYDNNPIYNTNGRQDFLEAQGIMLSRRDYLIIDSIFYHDNSREVLKNNNYNYFEESDTYRNGEEEEYCKTVTLVLTEIMIKSFNQIRYHKNYDYRYDYRKEEFLDMMKKIEENYDEHYNEVINQKGKSLKKEVKMGDYLVISSI